MKLKLSILLVAMVLVLSACGGGKNSADSKVSADDVISKFVNAGIDVKNAGDLSKDDYGAAPMLAKEAKRILVPALGEDQGGRVFVFDKEGDLEKTKAYYDELGKASAMLFSHTYAKGNVLLQMTGEMEESEFNKYKEVMDKL